MQSNSTLETTRKPLLETDTTLAIVYIAMMGIAILIGTCGNTLILLVSTVMKGINKSGKEFIINLAMADICVTAIAEPLCIIGMHNIFTHLTIKFLKPGLLLLWSP